MLRLKLENFINAIGEAYTEENFTLTEREFNFVFVINPIDDSMRNVNGFGASTQKLLAMRNIQPLFIRLSNWISYLSVTLRFSRIIGFAQSNQSGEYNSLKQRNRCAELFVSER